MPVVAMKYIRREPQAPAAFEHGAREEQEAAMLIRIEGIQVAAVEQRRTINEIHRDIASRVVRRQQGEPVFGVPTKVGG